MASAAANISSHVVGTVMPHSEKYFGEYHTRDFMFEPSGAA